MTRAARPVLRRNSRATAGPGPVGYREADNDNDRHACKGATGGAVGTGADGKATTPAAPGTAVPGLRLGSVGTLSVMPPVALGASGSQASTTRSAIAPGSIAITSGDAASRQVAQTIGRDTGAANGALTQQFTEQKRAEIAQGFAAAQLLTTQVGTFLAG